MDVNGSKQHLGEGKGTTNVVFFCFQHSICTFAKAAKFPFKKENGTRSLVLLGTRQICMNYEFAKLAWFPFKHVFCPRGLQMFPNNFGGDSSKENWSTGVLLT